MIVQVYQNKRLNLTALVAMDPHQGGWPPIAEPVLHSPWIAASTGISPPPDFRIINITKIHGGDKSFPCSGPSSVSVEITLTARAIAVKPFAAHR
jgi:hypothetical protein